MIGQLLDTYHWAPSGFLPRNLRWFWFWSQSRKKNTVREGLLLLFWLFICWFSSIGKSKYNHVYVFTNTLCVIFSLKTNYIWPNTLFPKIHQGNKRAHKFFVQKTFTTDAQLKKPLYVCVGQRFGWEIYFPLLSELNRFQPAALSLQGILCGTAEHRWITVF